jgi:hypothetical protein
VSSRLTYSEPTPLVRYNAMRSYTHIQRCALLISLKAVRTLPSEASSSPNHSPEKVHDHIGRGSIDIAIKKAFTSRAFNISTRDLAQHSQSGGEFFGIHVSNGGRVMIFAGGVPLQRGGKVVGAIGVSGGSGEQDHAVAEAGARAFE